MKNFMKHFYVLGMLCLVLASCKKNLSQALNLPIRTTQELISSVQKAPNY